MLGSTLIGIVLGIIVVAMMIRSKPGQLTGAVIGMVSGTLLLAYNDAMAYGFTAVVVLAALMHLPLIRTRYPA